MFGLGLTADATGTFLMTRIAESGQDGASGAGGLGTLMAVTGTIALALMAVHLVWAIVVLIRNNEQEKITFHRFSVIVGHLAHSLRRWCCSRNGRGKLTNARRHRG